MVVVAQCPECEHDLIIFEEVESGQYVRCKHCGADLEIVDADTMEMDWAFRPFADWDGWEELDAFLETRWKKSTGRRKEPPDINTDDWDEERQY